MRHSLRFHLSRIKLLSAVLLGLTVLPALAVLLPFPADAATLPGSGWNFQTAVQHLLLQVQNLGPVGVVAFVGLYALATVAFVPGSLLTLGAGAVYGLLQGSLYVLLGASLGALLAFWTGRYLARDWVARKIEADPKFKAIDQAVGRDGFKIVLLTRLSPVFPFTLLNYAFGITSVRLRDYLLGNIGMVPGTVLYVYLGSLTGSLAQLGNKVGNELGEAPAPQTGIQWAVRIIGLAATLAITLYATRIARRALAETTDAADAQSLSNDAS